MNLKSIQIAIFVFLVLFSPIVAFVEASESNRILLIQESIPWHPFDLNSTTPPGSRGPGCGEDRSLYALAKATGLAALSINNATSAQGASQWFDVPESLTISGFDFYAYSVDFPTEVVGVTCSLYLSDPSGFPTGAPLGSTTISVGNDIGGGTLPELLQSVTFAQPVVVSTPFVLVVENHSALSMAVIANDWNTANGAQEWLSSVDLFGTWTNSENVNVGGVPLDADWLFEPRYTVDPLTDFVPTPLCISGAETVDFANMSSPIFLSPFYSQAAFLAVPEASFDWDMGDGTAIPDTDSPSHPFTDAGPHLVVLNSELTGWERTCPGQRQRTIGVADSYYPDLDNDGFGDPNVAPTMICDPSSGYVLDNTDCDDSASSCTDDCSDVDGDGHDRCIDLCTDSDFDDFGVDTTDMIVGSGTASVGQCMIDSVTPCFFPDLACIAPDVCPGFDDAIDSDNDGVPDGCDLCLGDDSSGDGDIDFVCADLDCNDGDSGVQFNDGCGVCGGDNSSCGIFEDGFETGDILMW